VLGEVPVLEMAAAYEDYVGLLSAAGHAVELPVLARHLAGGEQQAAGVAAALQGRQDDGAFEQVAAERMQTLLAGLADELREALGRDGPRSPDGLLAVMRHCSEQERDAAADAVLLNGHRQFLTPSYVPLCEIRDSLAQSPERGELALVKVVPHVRRELSKRGFDVSEEEVGRWFDGAEDDCLVPRCLRRIVAELGPEFRTGLVGLEEMVGDADPDQWLETARVKLQFRSHSSMHKAIAEATSLKYDCVHKALSGRKKAKRIQAEIKYCLERWLRERDAGQDSYIPEDYRGVPVQRMHGLMARLESMYQTKEDIYRLISERTGIKTGSVRRYFQSNGQLKYAPLPVFRCAESLACETRAVKQTRSYLADARTRQVARDLARKANDALLRWQGNGETVENELAFKELRRALIVTLKEGRCRAPALARVG
jgi:hypothetical protein